jgi:hypothetical protein
LVFHYLGASFEVAQVTLDLLSLACVFTFLAVIRRVAPEWAAYAATIAFVLVGATSGNTFALFSLGVYTPAVLTGAIGLMLVFIGLIDYVHTGLTMATVILLLSGGLVNCLSRPECVAAVLLAIGCLAVVELRPRLTGRGGKKVAEVIIVASLVLGPSACVYAYLCRWIGVRALLEGITAYGLARGSCPWWPTGLGLCGAVAELAGAVACFGVLDGLAGRLVSRRVSHSVLRYSVFVVAAGVWVVFHVLFFQELTRRQPTRSGILGVANLLVSTNTVLLPIMWACCVLFIVEFFRYVRPRVLNLSAEDKIRFVMMGAVFGLSSRSLFNSAISNTPMITPAQYPVLLVVIFLLVRYALQTWSGLDRDKSPPVVHRIQIYVSLVLVLFGGCRLAGYVVREGKNEYVRLVTDAGAVRLSDDGVSRKAYEFLKARTLPGEPIADVAYGGGLNFALHRLSPLFTSQFLMFRPTVEQRQRDLVQLENSKTRFVVSQEPPSAKYGTGFGCAFPQIAWIAPGPREDANVQFPVMQFIEAHYRPAVHLPGVSIYTYDSEKMSNLLP